MHIRISISRFLPLALAMFAGGCSYNLANDKADFHMPLAYRQWEQEQVVLQNGVHACSLSSGYNGLTVLAGNLEPGKDVAVKSNRLMKPGSTLHVNVNGGNFETSDTFFSPQSAHEMLGYLTQGGKAYLEWSEMSGPAGSPRAHVQNVLRLDGFADALKQCRTQLNSK